MAAMRMPALFLVLLLACAAVPAMTADPIPLGLEGIFKTICEAQMPKDVADKIAQGPMYTSLSAEKKTEMAELLAAKPTCGPQGFTTFAKSYLSILGVNPDKPQFPKDLFVLMGLGDGSEAAVKQALENAAARPAAVVKFLSGAFDVTNNQLLQGVAKALGTTADKLSLPKDLLTVITQDSGSLQNLQNALKSVLQGVNPLQGMQIPQDLLANLGLGDGSLASIAQALNVAPGALQTIKDLQTAVANKLGISDISKLQFPQDFIKALGLGDGTLNTLASKVQESVKTLPEDLKTALSKLPGVGEITAENFRENLLKALDLGKGSAEEIFNAIKSGALASSDLGKDLLGRLGLGSGTLKDVAAALNIDPSKLNSPQDLINAIAAATNVDPSKLVLPKGFLEAIDLGNGWLSSLAKRAQERGDSAAQDVKAALAKILNVEQSKLNVQAALAKALGLGDGALSTIASVLKLKGAVERAQGTLKAGAEFTENAITNTIQKGGQLLGQATPAAVDQATSMFKLLGTQAGTLASNVQQQAKAVTDNVKQQATAALDKSLAAIGTSREDVAKAVAVQQAAGAVKTVSSAVKEAVTTVNQKFGTAINPLNILGGRRMLL